MNRSLAILILTLLIGCKQEGEGQPVVWFEQNHGGLHLFKIDLNQTLDNGQTLTASSTPYFADIGELPLPTNIMSGNNRIVATGWYTDMNGSTMWPMVLVTNVTGAGIEMVNSHGLAAFQSSEDLQTWTTTSAPSPYAVPMNKQHEYFKGTGGTLAVVFGSTPLPVQYLAYQDTNTIQSTSTPMPMP